METVHIDESSLPARLKKIRKVMQSAGNTIGAVHFRKRSNGELRKMAYRLHVRKPSLAAAPKPKDDGDKFRTIDKDKDNLQITVLDVNKVVRDKDGAILGRGAWRTVPLENVERIAVRGKIYEVVS
jgi:hypothetical protein